MWISIVPLRTEERNSWSVCKLKPDGAERNPFSFRSFPLAFRCKVSSFDRKINAACTPVCMKRYFSVEQRVWTLVWTKPLSGRAEVRKGQVQVSQEFHRYASALQLEVRPLYRFSMYFTGRDTCVTELYILVIIRLAFHATYRRQCSYRCRHVCAAWEGLAQLTSQRRPVHGQELVKSL